MLVIVDLIRSSSVKIHSEVRYLKTILMLGKLKKLFVLANKKILPYMFIHNPLPKYHRKKDHSVNNNKVKHS